MSGEQACHRFFNAHASDFQAFSRIGDFEQLIGIEMIVIVLLAIVDPAHAALFFLR